MKYIYSPAIQILKSFLEYLKFTAEQNNVLNAFHAVTATSLIQSYLNFRVKNPKPENAFLHIKNAIIYLIGPFSVYEF